MSNTVITLRSGIPTSDSSFKVVVEVRLLNDWNDRHSSWHFSSNDFLRVKIELACRSKLIVSSQKTVNIDFQNFIIEFLRASHNFFPKSTHRSECFLACPIKLGDCKEDKFALVNSLFDCLIGSWTGSNRRTQKCTPLHDCERDRCQGEPDWPALPFTAHGVRLAALTL